MNIKNFGGLKEREIEVQKKVKLSQNEQVLLSWAYLISAFYLLQWLQPCHSSNHTSSGFREGLRLWIILEFPTAVGQVQRVGIKPPMKKPQPQIAKNQEINEKTKEPHIEIFENSKKPAKRGNTFEKKYARKMGSWKCTFRLTFLRTVRSVWTLLHMQF